MASEAVDQKVGRPSAGAEDIIPDLNSGLAQSDVDLAPSTTSQLGSLDQAQDFSFEFLFC